MKGKKYILLLQKIAGGEKGQTEHSDGQEQGGGKLHKYTGTFSLPFKQTQIWSKRGQMNGSQIVADIHATFL